MPNTIARGLRTSRTGAVGVLIPDLTNPLFPPMVRGIEDRLAARGYTTLLGNTDNDDERERKQFLALRAWRVDGFIAATARRRHPLLSEAAAQGVPLVLVNRAVDGLPVPAVLADDAAGVSAAVEYLVALGHRYIGHLAGPPELSTGLTRARAFRAAMQAAGLPVPPAAEVGCAAFAEDAGRVGAHRLLAAYPHLTAIVAGNDLVALGALGALAEAGRICPDEVSVVGFNDMPFVDKMSPALTTVRVPHHELGAQAAQLLLERLDQPCAEAKTLLLPARLVVRGSTGPPPGPPSPA